MKGKMKTIDLTLVAVFVALMAVGANTSFLVVGGVPITLQTFFAILAGAILGSRLGAISMVVYALVGMVGAPVFAQFTGGISIIIKPTFGFIISFIFTAYIVGKMVERNRSLPSYVTASLVGMTVNYLFGTNWMYFAYDLWAGAPDGFSYKMAWLWMVAPLPKDIILSVCAAFFAHRMERTVLSRSTFRNVKKAA
ncbi:biotin transporter BioY [Peribacillus glennii]|uniref:Biotin transporter n=1 Tax=Peribacillus glennii TaxID=2303991 RepID=A0A372LK70_9BACI|nr:biotin transporter BioY [Peribacillus glennii]RFU66606.1 biotin transporter BioY [Peribacillus glennii]